MPESYVDYRFFGPRFFLNISYGKDDITER